jgi:hypothetical protein
MLTSNQRLRRMASIPSHGPRVALACNPARHNRSPTKATKKTPLDGCARASVCPGGV